MNNSILDQLWYRLVSWWMHRHGAQDIEVEYMDKEFTIPVYPLSIHQQARLSEAVHHIEDNPGVPYPGQVPHALMEIQDLAEEVTEYKVSDFPTELVVEILTEAPKEGRRS